MDPIYELENRGFEYFFHWVFLTLSGLRFLEKPDKKVDIYMPWLKEFGFHYEALKYFEDKFNFFTKKEDVSGRKIILFHGETLLTADRIADDGYAYIRSKILSKISYSIIPKKYIYISRKNSVTLVSNSDRGQHHCILNEDELVKMISAFGFEVIYLEDYSFNEKVRIFCESEIIMAPYGGSLVSCIFSSSPQKIIELVDISVHNSGWKHYKIICEKTGTPHFTFSEINHSDNNKNINLKIDKLHELLKGLITE